MNKVKSNEKWARFEMIPFDGTHVPDKIRSCSDFDNYFMAFMAFDYNLSKEDEAKEKAFLIYHYRILSNRMKESDDAIWFRCKMALGRLSQYDAIGYISKAALEEGLRYEKGTYLAWLENDYENPLVTAIVTANKIALTLRFIWTDPITEFETVARGEPRPERMSLELIRLILDALPPTIRWIFMTPSQHLLNLLRRVYRVKETRYSQLDWAPIKTDTQYVIDLQQPLRRVDGKIPGAAYRPTD